MKRRRQLLRSPWFATAIVIGAVWINRDHVRSLSGLVGEETVDPGIVAEAPATGVDGRIGATPSGAPLAPTFAPARLETRLEDPFAHDLETRMAAVPAREAATVDLDLPTVSLVLVGPAMRRAIVDDRIVGVGDRIELGRIEAVETTGIRVVTKARGTVHVPLTTKPRTEDVSAEGAVVEDPGREAVEGRSAPGGRSRGKRR
ncbi:MAG: hypothetical protein H6832_12965 [Planctomycetes bacterium]|nr:hypothetical protein [Planctomycetota bacterium]